MSDVIKTPLSDRTRILSEMWAGERANESLQDLFAYGDIAFPLAYCIEEGVVAPTLVSEKYIDDLWEKLLLYFGIEDTGEYDDWSEIGIDAGWTWQENS
jgi:hypothetical protein